MEWIYFGIGVAVILLGAWYLTLGSIRKLDKDLAECEEDNCPSRYP